MTKRDRKKLLTELGNLQHRREHLVLSKATLAREALRILEIIDQLRPQPFTLNPELTP